MESGKLHRGMKDVFEDYCWDTAVGNPTSKPALYGASLTTRD
jgi:hypothetical protein